ncbi:MAG: hypothetical protein Q8O88_02500 [bacterium]|nr:hypothetical protein [bacterium]
MNEELQSKVNEIKGYLAELKSTHHINQKSVHYHLQRSRKFLQNYPTFNKYINGTLANLQIKPALLNQVLEGIKELVVNPQSLLHAPQTGQVTNEIKNHLVNKGGWWLYHYNDNTNFIARSSLTFNLDGTVKVNNPDATKERLLLEGIYDISDQILKIIIPKNKHGKELIIILQLYNSETPDIILGQYISPNISSNITSGSVIVERKDQNDITMDTPPAIFSNQGSALQHYSGVVHESIRRYFCSRQLNYQKTPNKQVVDYRTLSGFLDNYKPKGDDVLNHQYDFFISSPVFSCSSYQKFKEIRDSIMKIIDILKQQGYDRIKYIGEEITDERVFKLTKKVKLIEPGQEHFIDDLIKSKHHLVFFPSKHLSTGAFIEIGISLRQNKPLAIFFERDADLPFMLRKLQGNEHRYKVRFSQVSNIKEIFHKIKGKDIHDFLPKH